MQLHYVKHVPITVLPALLILQMLDLLHVARTQPSKIILQSKYARQCLYSHLHIQRLLHLVLVLKVLKNY